MRPLIPAAKKKLKALMDSDDVKVAYSAVMGVLSYVYGKPIDRRELGGPDGKPLVPDVPKLSTLELARRILFVLDKAKREAEEVNGPAGPAEAASGGDSGFSHLVPEPAPEPEPERTEPKPGEIAYVAGFIVECIEATRPGLPLTYHIHDDERRPLTQAVGGWEGALKWIKSRAGADADMTPHISKPAPRFPEVVSGRPEQRWPASRLPVVHRHR